MTHVPHELNEEFPELRDRIRDLKAADAHFARLVDEYHDINRTVHRIESSVQPTSEDVEKQLRRQRLLLKDQIAELLRA